MPDSILERIYYRSPIWFQNIAFSSYGYRLKSLRFGNDFKNYLKNLNESQWWPAEKIHEHQAIQLNRLFKYAYEHVPFYRDLWNEHGVNIGQLQDHSDLHKIPIINKQMVRDNLERMKSELYRASDLLVTRTSGTTGTPLIIYRDRPSVAFQWAIWSRHKARFDLNYNDKHVVLGARVPVHQRQKSPPYWRKDFFNNRYYLSSYHINKNNLRSILAFLDDNDFVFYTGYPSAMNVLACLLEEEGLSLKNPPKYIVSGSDTLLEPIKERFIRIFKAPVTDQYGMAEFAGNLSKCENEIFHLDFECCYLEDRPCQQADELHGLVLTGWGNLAMPFIRYEIGDLGSMKINHCECGRQSVGFERMAGRLEDYLRTPGGGYVIGMNQVLEYAENAREMQIYQDNLNSIEIRVVPAADFGRADKEALIRECRRRLPEEMRIDFLITDHIPKTPSGKFRAVLSELPPVLEAEREIK